MTVDNTSEKSIFYGPSDVLSTSAGTFFLPRPAPADHLWIVMLLWQLSTAAACFVFFYFQHYVQVT